MASIDFSGLNEWTKERNKQWDDWHQTEHYNWVIENNPFKGVTVDYGYDESCWIMKSYGLWCRDNTIIENNRKIGITDANGVCNFY